MRIFAALLVALAGCCTAALNPADGQFRWPVSGSVFQGFYGNQTSGQVAGPYYDEHDQLKTFNGPGLLHRAIDIDASTGTPVQAARDGIAHRYDWDGKNGYGNHVVVDHGQGYFTLYAHFSSIDVAEGQKVRQGDVLGKVGQTGNATGPHLHFEIRHSQDPNNLALPHYIPGDAGQTTCQGRGVPHVYPGLP